VYAVLAGAREDVLWLAQAHVIQLPRIIAAFAITIGSRYYEPG